MQTCIIIDDEPKARLLLQSIVEQYCPGLKLVAQCEDLPAGVKAIKKHHPALVFLDIEMPGHSGLELLDFFNEDEVDFSIIFTTAYNEHALQAFRFSAIDYLLKPLQHTHLVEAVNRFLKKQTDAEGSRLKNLRHNLDSSVSWADKRIAVTSGQTLHFLKPSDIVMIKGEAAYSELYLANGGKMLASRNLKHFEDMLAGIPIFFRSHKSYIVNRLAVQQYVKSDGGYLVLPNGLQAGISSEKVAEFLQGM